MTEPFLPPEPKPEHEHVLPAPVGNQRAARRVVIFSDVLLVILLMGVAGLVMRLDESNERSSAKWSSRFLTSTVAWLFSFNAVEGKLCHQIGGARFRTTFTELLNSNNV